MLEGFALAHHMVNPDINTKWSKPAFVGLSIVISVVVACLSWSVTAYCPRTQHGIDAFKSTWSWLGYACENQLGPGAILFFFASIWLLGIHSTLNVAVLFLLKARRLTKYVSLAVVATMFFIVYLLLFIF